ncbi:helix-turn-helix transcriptional regulator [Schleiferilactobacillus harbinensis]|uniref:helix-turn-helix domain-containing protein n=1 Tax=Schleiferilactobacillus harbinensis TaxID=304207 RepID=UPI001AAF4CA2|nr:helix-turn-helix transcriptional regulator [Schleiferilactobacillus harbinensis]MBO3093168.1 helix-turn-helix transcriptional regulator [Schleiferilactobacillus harbinensis]
MTLFERIQNTAKKRGMSLRELNNRAGLGTNAIYRWKKSKPAADKLQAVADVLHVSVDYLLGNTDDPSTDSKKPVDLSGTNVFTYQGMPIPEDDWEIIQDILKRRREQLQKKKS